MLLSHPHLLLQAADIGNLSGGLQLLQQARQTNAEILEGWTTVQSQVFVTGGLWRAVGETSAIFLPIAFGFYAFNEYLRLRHAANTATVFELFQRLVLIPLPIAILLANDAQLLLDLVFAIRNIGFGVVNDVLTQQIGRYEVREALDLAGDNWQARNDILEAFRPCQELIGEELQVCIERQSGVAERIINDLPADTGGVARATLDGITSVFGSILSGNLVLDSTAALIQTVFGASPSLLIFQGILFAIQAAFLHAVHAALVLSLLFAQVPVALALAPWGINVLYGWISGIIGLFTLMFGYNLILGFMAALFAETNPSLLSEFSDTIYAIFIGIFAPLLASAVGGGAGIAIFQSLRTAQAAVLGAGLTIAGGVVQGSAAIASIQAAATLSSVDRVPPQPPTPPPTSSAPLPYPEVRRG